jgi:hypothetical protein
MGTLGEGVTKGAPALLDSTRSVFGDLITAPMDLLKGGMGKLAEIVTAENPFEALKNNIGAGVGAMFGKAKALLPSFLTAPLSPDATQSITPVMGEMPPLPSANMEVAASGAGSKGTADKGGSKTINIHIASISLPNVKNAYDFGEDLKRLAISMGAIGT